MQLQPQEYFTIVRQLQDPADVNTYYVQAVIRNARTDAVIDTINLTDRGSRRFSLPWQVPADTSGLGFYISVLTSVYTDSGRTTKSDQYGEEMETYLVDNRFRNLGGGGGGSDVDYKKIRVVFQEVLAEVFFYQDGNFRFLPNFQPLFEKLSSFGLSSLTTWFNTSREKLNLIEVKVDRAREGIQQINPPTVSDIVEKIEKTNIQPVIEAINNLSSLQKLDVDSVKNSVTSFSDLLKEVQKVTASFPNLSSKASDIEKQLKDFLYILATKEEPEEEVKPVPKDHLEEAHRILNIPYKK